MVTQLTVRNPSSELVQRLRALSKERGESLNATILFLLERALGVDARREWLEQFATWTQEEYEEFEESLREQRRIDPEIWE